LHKFSAYTGFLHKTTQLYSAQEACTYVTKITRFEWLAVFSNGIGLSRVLCPTRHSIGHFGVNTGMRINDIIFTVIDVCSESFCTRTWCKKWHKYLVQDIYSRSLALYSVLWAARHMSSAYINLRAAVSGQSEVKKLNSIGASTEPWGSPFFCLCYLLLLLSKCTQNWRFC